MENLNRLAKRSGPTEIRTRVVGFKVQSDSHYTIGPRLIGMILNHQLKCIHYSDDVTI